MAESRGRRTKIRGIFACVCICGAVLFDILFSGTAYAGSMGTVSVRALVQKDENSAISLPEVSFLLYRVGTAENGQWKLCGKFADSGAKLDLTDSARQEAVSAELADYAKRHRISGRSGATDAQGNLTFSGVERGLYLLVQNGSVRQRKDIYQSAPAIFSVPGPGNIWQVTVEPKFENQSIPAKPSKESGEPEESAGEPVSAGAVKTGDLAGDTWLVCLIAGGIMVTALLLQRKQRVG